MSQWPKPKVSGSVSFVGLRSRASAAGKKKPEAENIPPPEPISKSSQAVPLSPSKRRQSTEHYSDVESSPSKKRLAAATNALEKIHLEDSERGLLFGNNSTNIQTTDVSEGFGMGPAKERPIARSRRARVAVAAESKKLASNPAADIWVEIPS